MIVIVDYGSGNLNSVQKAIVSLGHSAIISNLPTDIAKADILVVPGQGAFSDAMKTLRENGLLTGIIQHIRNKKPFLGICLGFQLLFERSLEHGDHSGLGCFFGTVAPFPQGKLKVPHMGWNTLMICKNPYGYYSHLPETPYVYFVHSYYVPERDGSEVGTLTSYGVPFISSIQTETLLATQFHPEKSGEAGLVLLKNFFKKMT